MRTSSALRRATRQLRPSELEVLRGAVQSLHNSENDPLAKLARFHHRRSCVWPHLGGTRRFDFPDVRTRLRSRPEGHGQRRNPALRPARSRTDPPTRKANLGLMPSCLTSCKLMADLSAKGVQVNEHALRKRMADLTRSHASRSPSRRGPDPKRHD